MADIIDLLAIVLNQDGDLWVYERYVSDVCTDLPGSSADVGADPSINTDKTSQPASVYVTVSTCPRVFLLPLIDDDALPCLPSFCTVPASYTQYLTVI